MLILQPTRHLVTRRRRSPAAPQPTTWLSARRTSTRALMQEYHSSRDACRLRGQVDGFDAALHAAVQFQ